MLQNLPTSKSTAMNFDFSDEQKQLRDEARKFLAEKCPPKAVRAVLDGNAPYDRQLWKGLADMGFLGVAIPESYGGTGAGHLELCVIAEEMGRALAPVPFSSTVYLAAEAILMAGSEAQKQKWLPLIASGEAIGTLALFEGKGNPSPHAIKLTASDRSLDGVKKPVADGAIADFAIVAARTNSSGRDSDISLFLVDMKAEGVEAKVLTNIDPSRGQAELIFKNCKAEPFGAANEGWSVVLQVLDRAAVLMAFEQVGGADRALEMGRDYGEAHACRHVCLGNAGAIELLLQCLGALDQRLRIAGGRRRGTDQRGPGVPALRQEQYPGSWRHGIHLGIRLPSVLPACERNRAVAWLALLLGGRADRPDAETECGLNNERRRPRESGDPYSEESQ
jgi:alkylation response protein AidB-like acyl-CoA dehydrogenase